MIKIEINNQEQISVMPCADMIIAAKLAYRQYGVTNWIWDDENDELIAHTANNLIKLTIICC